ncbi:MAG: methionine biosynthesis protein MetW [bacterium]|nr:methionine biosynthesis protein MetW [bacterium]
MKKTSKVYIQKITDFIEPDTKVLDLGCGNGELLEYLRNEKKIKGYGIEIDFNKIIDCVKRGIYVFHGNIDEGLPEFTKNSYDYVILSQTLQQVHKPSFVLSEMLRVGKKVIVTFPNFGFWSIRAQLFFKGVPPKTAQMPYDWHNTPNIRIITIKSFRKLCKTKNITILNEIPICRKSLIHKVLPEMNPNLFSREVMFVICKKI